MKIIQVSDLHLGRRGQLHFGVDLHERLDRCIAHINARHADATLCVFTGDLTDAGEPGSYADIKAALNALSVPYRLLPGNHDKRTNLVAAFPEHPLDDSGFVQSAYDTAEGPLLFLDTLAEGRTEGELCQSRLAWLEARLSEAKGRPALVFMHHPPTELGLAELDPLGLENPERFLGLLRQHGNSRIFFGHVHRDVAGVVAGVPFFAQRGLHARFPLDFDGPGIAVEKAPPSYAVILVDRAGERVVVHACDFLEQWPAYWADTGELVASGSI
ncbi:MAG: phosphodiesterase [Mesorhizobium sp.]